MFLFSFQGCYYVKRFPTLILTNGQNKGLIFNFSLSVGDFSPVSH